MQELNMMEINEVSGGGAWVEFGMRMAESVAASIIYDSIKGGGEWLMENSHMGRGEFPTPPRAGHE